MKIRGRKKRKKKIRGALIVPTAQMPGTWAVRMSGRRIGPIAVDPASEEDGRPNVEGEDDRCQREGQGEVHNPWPSPEEA